MAVIIKNPEVELLIEELVAITGETKLEAVRRALVERKARLVVGASQPDRWQQAMRFLEREVWPSLPQGEIGRCLSRAEEDMILGYGSEGV